jgi:uncharacterized repeat protein (TIGR01451 family)
MPGESIDLQIEVNADQPQDINDRVTVSSLTPDPDPGGNVDEDGISVVASADLALAKTDSPDPVIAGTQLNYSLEVTNNGPSDAVNVVVEDNLPVGVTVISVTAPGGSCNAGIPGDSSQPTKCAFDSLPVGAAGTMALAVAVLPGILGPIHNDAEVSSQAWDPDNSNNFATASTEVQAEADLAVVKEDNPDPAVAGTDITYAVRVTNLGPSLARTVMLSDSLPSAVRFLMATVSGGTGTCEELEVPPNTIHCSLGDLEPEEFVDLFFKTTVDPSVPDGASIGNTASVTSMTDDPVGVNNSATETTTILTEADLELQKYSSFLTGNPSSNLVYTLEITNRGPSDAQNVAVIDRLPLTYKKVQYVFDSGNGACTYDQATHTVNCGFGTMVAGATLSLEIVVKVKGSVGAIENTAEVSSDTIDPSVGNNSSTIITNVKGGSSKK